MKNGKNLIFSVLMILIVTLFLAIVVMIAKGRFSAKSDYEKDLVVAGFTVADLRARAPYVMFRPEPGNAWINSLGFRSPEISKEKSENEYRIAILGGSVVFNGNTNDSTIVGNLAKILKENAPELKDKDIVYINGAIPSAVSGQELALFIYHLLPLQIDLLVVYDGINDLWCPLNGFDPRPGYPYDYFIEEYRYRNFISNRGWWATFLLLFDWKLWKSSKKNISIDYFKELGIERPPAPELKRQTVDAYIDNITKISRIASGYGIKCAIFLQPYSKNHIDVNKSTDRDLVDVYETSSERYRALAEGNSPARIFYDLSYLSDEMKDLFTDICHHPDSGNEIVAKEMYSVMKKEGMYK